MYRAPIGADYVRENLIRDLNLLTESFSLTPLFCV